MKKIKLILLCSISLFAITGCSQSIEKQIVGTWEKNDDCDNHMDNKISFDDDGNVVGIEGFKTYEIKETDNEDYDYAVLSGGYEDSGRYRIKIDEEDNLHIVQEEDDTYDFDSFKSCSLTKTDDNT